MGRSIVLAYALLFASGCAMGRMTFNDGTIIEGIAVGDSRIASCAERGSASEALLDGPCSEISGGAVSSTFAGLLSGAIAALATAGVF